MPACVQCQDPKASRACGRCLTATYCSVDCQRAHWKEGQHRLACTVSEPLFQAPRAYKAPCAHRRGSLVWLGSADKEPRAFCSAECATEWLGYPAVVVNGTPARAFLLGRVNKDPDSPLRRLFQHHFHLEHDASAPMARELAQLSAEHVCGPLDNKPLLKEKEPVGKRPPRGDDECYCFDLAKFIEFRITRTDYIAGASLFEIATQNIYSFRTDDLLPCPDAPPCLKKKRSLAAAAPASASEQVRGTRKWHTNHVAARAEHEALDFDMLMPVKTRKIDPSKCSPKREFEHDI